jgi:anti-sigma factor RsiW
VIRRAHHLEEERLFDSYLAERNREPLDPPVAEHLADCASCGTRYAELSAFMDTLRRDGDAEADAIFTPERLRLQQQQIARRIAHVGRPTRVLSFPGRLVQRTIDASTSRTAPRWVAAAAAAGIFVGVAVGASFQWRSPRQSRQSSFAADPGSARAARTTPAVARGSMPADLASDDVFLSDLEIALERPHTRELLAFDALTPHVREIRDQR